MGLVSISRAGWHLLGASVWAIGVAMYQPLLRGDVQLASADPQAMPRVRQHAGLSHHRRGTCRMGADDDPMAVLDQSCRVRGVDRPRVVDASAFPLIVRAGMYLPVMMLAEKAADLIKAG